MQDVLSFMSPFLLDGHVHLREAKKRNEKRRMGVLVKNAVRGGAGMLGPMPNTVDGLMDAAQVNAYVSTAKTCVPRRTRVDFVPIVMINEKTTPAMLDECRRLGIMDGKVYPLNRTTQSHYGVRDYADILPAVRHMGTIGMRCHMHPEHPWMTIPNCDAEYQFLGIMDMFIRQTKTVMVWEHGTDGRCVPFWEEMARTQRFYLTLTPHHLAANADDTYGDTAATCKPSYKPLWSRLALLALVEKNYRWVIGASDVAPHDVSKKHVAGKGCACGAYHGDFTLPLYAHALDELLVVRSGARIFGNFIHYNARQLYDLAEFSEAIKLERRPYQIPLFFQIGDWRVEPFWAGREILWSIAA